MGCIKIYVDTEFLSTGAPLVMDMYLRNSLWWELEKLGVYKVENSADADYVLTSNMDLGKTKILRKKTIVIENSDGCHFGYMNQMIDDPLLCAWIKRYKTSDYTLSGGRKSKCFFAPVLGFETPKKEYHPLPKHLDKVYSGLSFLCSDHIVHRHRRATEYHQTDTDRDIDVFFAGTTQYGSTEKKNWIQNIVTHHRTSMIETLDRIEGINIVAENTKSFNFFDYVDYMKRSKIIIAPWGLGEACYREYESLLYECDVIKPATPYFVESNPDLFNVSDSPFLHWVKPDWSNLFDIVRQCLDSWEDRSDERRQKKYRLIDNLSYKSQAMVIRGILDNVNYNENERGDSVSEYPDARLTA